MDRAKLAKAGMACAAAAIVTSLALLAAEGRAAIADTAITVVLMSLALYSLNKLKNR